MPENDANPGDEWLEKLRHVQRLLAGIEGDPKLGDVQEVVKQTRIALHFMQTRLIGLHGLAEMILNDMPAKERSMMDGYRYAATLPPMVKACDCIKAAIEALEECHRASEKSYRF